MIEIKDLQIGDWVMTPYGWHKVDTIYGSIERLLADMIEFDTSELDAIPLTPEILEKNEFVSNDNAFGHQDYNLFDDFFLENRGDRFCISRRLSKYGGSSYFVMEIRYVHILQHFLRLCGIEKEIIL